MEEDGALELLLGSQSIAWAKSQSTAPLHPSRGAQLCQEVKCLQRRMEALTDLHRELRDESDALRECLEDAGVLHLPTLLARQHRRRFARVCTQHPPFGFYETLETFAGVRERVFALAELLGPSGTAAFADASRTTASGVCSVSLELASMLPARIYAIGGEDDDGQALASVERLCPATGVWEPVRPMGAARKWCTAASLAGLVYVVGGWGADDNTLDTVDRFDPWAGKWELLPCMSCRRGAAAVVAVGGAIWATGGQDGRFVHGSVEALDPIVGLQGGWATLPNMLQPRHAAGAVQIDGQVFAIGGRGVDNLVLGGVERFDTSLCSWIALPPLRTPRAGLAAAAVGGMAYVVGGCDLCGRDLGSLECFDPDVGQWEILTSLAVPRWGLAAAACGGRLYALGGGDCAEEDACIGACERFTPPSRRAQGSPRISPRPSPRFAGGAPSWGGAPPGTAIVTGSNSAAIAGNWAFVGCLRLPRRLFGAASTR